MDRNVCELVSDDLMTKRVYESHVEGGRAISRLCTRWLDGVKKACPAISLELRDAKVKCLDS